MASPKQSVICDFISQGVELTFRRLNKEDVNNVDQMYQITRGEGWTTLYEDLLECYVTEPNVFYGAFPKSQPDKLISVCSLTPWCSEVSVLQFFLTEKSYRRKGIGKQIFKLVLNQRCTPNIILSALPGLSNMYQQMGFTNVGFRIIPFYGTCHSDKCKSVGSYHISTASIHDLTDDTLNMLFEFDKAIYSIDRSKFLATWLYSPVSKVYIAVKDGNCVGYVCVRHKPSAKVSRLAPFAAESPDVALKLLDSVLSDCVGLGRPKGFLVYIPEFSGMDLIIDMYRRHFCRWKEFDAATNISLNPMNEYLNLDKIYSLTSDSTCNPIA